MRTWPWVKTRALWAGVIVVVVSIGGIVPPKALAAKKDKAAESGSATLVFPIKGNLDPDQGAIEAVFCLDYSYGDPMLKENESAAWLFPLLAVHDRKGVRYEHRQTEGLSFQLGFSQHRGDDHFALLSNRFERKESFGEPTVYILFAKPGAEGNPFLKAGDWHTLASTWSRKDQTFDLALYIDGEKVKAYPLPAHPQMGKEKFDPKDLLFIGNPHKTLGLLQSLRISKRARTAEEIAAASKAGLVKDADTLLFVDANTAAKMRTDKREELLGGRNNPRSVSVPDEGKVYGHIEIVAGRDGAKAIRLQTP